MCHLGWQLNSVGLLQLQATIMATEQPPANSPINKYEFVSVPGPILNMPNGRASCVQWPSSDRMQDRHMPKDGSMAAALPSCPCGGGQPLSA
jgi:hypothetical protein